MPSNSKVVFSVGCFHFGFHPKESLDFTGNDYISELKKALFSIPNIEDLEVDAFNDFKFQKFNSEASFDRLDEGSNFFPFPASSMEITFTLFIPKRVQNEIKKHYDNISTSCERFVVTTYYTFHFPITIVKALTNSSDFDSSDGIIICREFLSEQFNKDENSIIKFECFGPSPFHSNFSLIPSSTDNKKKIYHERIPSQAYDDYLFYYSKHDFEDINDAFNHLIFNLEFQIGLFYLINHERLLRDKIWVKFYNEFQDTMDKYCNRGLFFNCYNIFKSASTLNNLMLDLISLEAHDLNLRYYLEKEVKESYLGDKPPELLPHLEISLSDLTKLPFLQVKEILAFLETRRSKRINVIMMFLSAIFGGAVGSLLIILFKNNI